jgi:serine phosphatase RsbU (regulator of sigma subunit)
MIADLVDCYRSLSQIKEKAGNTGEALQYYKLFAEMKDSMINDNKTKFISNLQEDYEINKKEQENKVLQAQNEVSATTIKQQKLVSYFITAGLLLAIALAFFIFRGYRQKQKANEIIMHQKEEVEKQKSIAEEKSIIVEEKNKEILDSIHYAKRIQSALLTSEKYMKKILPEHFVFYKPKDIVSGDFYWSVKHHDKIYFAAADCTGHGVPGAFMSLVGISFLNEILVEKKIYSPEKILDQLRDDIIRTLNPEESIEETKDGMDIVLCCYDPDTKELQFAAANNPLYLIRNGKLTEYKADKFPVGKYYGEMLPFTLQSIPLQPGDLIYTFTDGYADQFGGPDGKKYKYKQLQNLLLSFHAQPMEKQKQKLDDEMIAWKGNLEQVDDILIIGIKI